MIIADDGNIFCLNIDIAPGLCFSRSRAWTYQKGEKSFLKAHSNIYIENQIIINQKLIEQIETGLLPANSFLLY